MYRGEEAGTRFGLYILMVDLDVSVYSLFEFLI